MGKKILFPAGSYAIIKREEAGYYHGVWYKGDSDLDQDVVEDWSAKENDTNINGGHWILVECMEPVKYIKKHKIK